MIGSYIIYKQNQAYGWASDIDGVTTIKQRWVNVSCAQGNVFALNNV